MVDDTTSVLRSSGVSVCMLLRSPTEATCWRLFICGWARRPDLSTIVISIATYAASLHRMQGPVVPIDDATDNIKAYLAQQELQFEVDTSVSTSRQKRRCGDIPDLPDDIEKNSTGVR